MFHNYLILIPFLHSLAPESLDSTKEIGTWFDSGAGHATIRVDSVDEDQAPGVSLALGVLYGSREGRVNDAALSQVSCGSDVHWSVHYGHGAGKEYLGNKWGKFGFLG